MDSQPNGSDFSKNHDDIKITQEEAQFLEKQFLKYLAREMEKNSSNWEEFYDILKQESSNVNTNNGADVNNPTTTTGGYTCSSSTGAGNLFILSIIFKYCGQLSQINFYFVSINEYL